MAKRRWMTTFDDRGTMVQDVARFVDCIEEDAEPVMNPAFAAPFTEVILAGYRSAATGETVALPLSG